jgi:ABC-type antimicrobial peptide transport system permease subunit
VRKTYPDMNALTNQAVASSVVASATGVADLATKYRDLMGLAAISFACLLSGLLAMSSTRLRTRDFGTLTAIGWSRMDVIRLVLTEAAIKSTIGALLGLALGFLFIAAVLLANPHLELHAPAMADSVAGIGSLQMDAPLSVTIPVSVAPDWAVIARTLLTAAGAGLVSAVSAGLLILRLPPMRAIRGLG